MRHNTVHATQYSTCDTIQYMRHNTVHATQYSTCDTIQYMRHNTVHATQYSTCDTYNLIELYIVRSIHSTCDTIQYMRYNTVHAIYMIQLDYINYTVRATQYDPIGSYIICYMKYEVYTEYATLSYI